MQTLQHTLRPIHVHQAQPNVLRRFFNWSAEQEENRFGWVASILAIHGCVLAPITVLTMAMTNNNMFFWALIIVAMAMCLVTNLAAMPTKITIPVFFLSVAIDAAVIAASVATLLQ